MVLQTEYYLDDKSIMPVSEPLLTTIGLLNHPVNGTIILKDVSYKVARMVDDFGPKHPHKKPIMRLTRFVFLEKQ